MTHSNDSRRPHRTRWQLTAAALVLLAGGAWARQEPILSLAIDPVTPTTLYAGTWIEPGGVFRSLNGGSSWQDIGLGETVCGDGLIMCGEQCDDRGESATCDADCTLPQCGDGVLNVSAGEQCDDGNRSPADGCTNGCTVCGDGVVTPPEECDDGNTVSGDACDAQCRWPHLVGTGTPASCTEAAFAAALAQRSVRFDCGPDPVTIALTSEKAITADTTIDGGGRITLSGGGAVRIFTVDESASLDVRNLNIADGHAEGSFSDYLGGGGIYNVGAVTLANCTLSGNSAGAGGGIFNYGTATLTNCTLSGNYASAAPNYFPGGGGIYNAGTVTLTDCTLSGNSAGVGGGIYNSYPRPSRRPPRRGRQA